MSLQHFNEEVPISSPRSLLICKRNGIDPEELMKPSQEAMRERLFNFPAYFRARAEEALEADRQQLIKYLTAEFYEFNFSHIQPAELVAFPELARFMSYYASASYFKTPNAVAHSPRLYNSASELTFIKSMAEKLQQSQYRFYEHYEAISRQRREMLEQRERERAEKIKKCYNTVSIRARTKFQTGYLTFRQQDSYLDQYKEAQQSQLNYRRAELIKNYLRKYEQISKYKRTEDAYRGYQRAECLSEYRRRIETAEQRRQSTLEHRLQVSKERRYIDEMRIQQARRDYEAQVEAEKQRTLEEFYERCDQLEQARQQHYMQIAQRNQLAFVRHNARLYDVRARRAENEKMRANRMRLYRELFNMREAQEQAKLADAYACALGSGIVQEELRERRLRRQREQHEFQRYVTMKNNEIEQKQREEMIIAANEHYYLLKQQYMAQEEKCRRELAELASKLYQVGAAVFPTKSCTASPIHSNLGVTKQKVLVNDYLTDYKSILKGYVEVRGWKEDV